MGHSGSFSNLTVIANVLILFLLIFFLYYIVKLKSPQVSTYPQFFAVNLIARSPLPSRSPFKSRCLTRSGSNIQSWRTEFYVWKVRKLLIC